MSSQCVLDQAQASTAPELVEGKLGLRFFLGDLPIGCAAFGILRCTRHFTRSEPWGSRPPVDWRQMPRHIQAVMYLSHPVDAPLPKLKAAQASLLYVPLQYNHYFVELASLADFDQYLGKFNARTRGNLRRAVRKYLDYCAQENPCREFSLPEQMDEFYQAARQISQKTYQERLGGNGFPSGDGFRKHLSERAADGLMRGYILYHGQRPVAYFYGTVNEKAVVSEYLGYDPEYRHWSVGTVLSLLILKHLIEERHFEMLDFGHSEQEYKRLLSTGTFRAADVHLFRPTLRNRLLLLSHVSLDALAALAGKILQVLHLKPTIKRLMRRR